MSNTNFKRGMSAIGWVIVLIVIAAIVIVAWWAMSGDDTNSSEGDTTVSNEDSSIAVRVNDEGVTKEKYDSRLKATTALAEKNGLDISDPAVQKGVKDQVIKDLISETLVMQDAKKIGIKIGADVIEAKIKENRDQFADAVAFQVALAGSGLDEDGLRELIIEQLTIQEYLSKKIDVKSIVVTDTEIQALYDSVAKTNSELPPLAEVKEEVRAQIVNNKTAELVAGLVKKLEIGSKIEILI